MKENVLRYLGYHNQSISSEMDRLIDDVIKEVKEVSDFHYVYQERHDKLSFLDNEAYKALLENCHSYLLIATTLGLEIDKRIKYYQMTDSTKALIFDAASSAYIIELADEFEKNFSPDKTYRFCPGYQNTSLADNEKILDLLKDLKIGISILDSKMLVPSKSMVGIIGIGTKLNKSCDTCLVRNCKYKEEGVVCFKK